MITIEDRFNEALSIVLFRLALAQFLGPLYQMCQRKHVWQRQEKRGRESKKRPKVLQFATVIIE